MNTNGLDAAAARAGITVDELVTLLRDREFSAMSPEDRAAGDRAQQAQAAALEAPTRKRMPGSRPVATAPPICNRCGRTISERDVPYPFGWVPEKRPPGEEMTEDEVPLPCCRYIEMGNPDDKAFREIECLKWARLNDWTPLPDPPVDPRCKFCKRPRSVTGDEVGACFRHVTIGSAQDIALRALECSQAAAELT